jgi:hypothetical protein
MTNFNFNNAGPQRSSDVIPEGTIVAVQVKIKPGGIGPGGWEKAANSGGSVGLDCEFTVFEPEPYAGHVIYQRMTLEGPDQGHMKAGKITYEFIRALIESAKGLLPNDKSEAAVKARDVTGWHEINGLCFLAKVDVVPPRDGYRAKNTLFEVITPDKQAWRKLDPPKSPGPSPSSPNGPSTTPPAGSVARPQWA